MRCCVRRGVRVQYACGASGRSMLPDNNNTAKQEPAGAITVRRETSPPAAGVDEGARRPGGGVSPPGGGGPARRRLQKVSTEAKRRAEEPRIEGTMAPRDGVPSLQSNRRPIELSQSAAEPCADSAHIQQRSSRHAGCPSFPRIPPPVAPSALAFATLALLSFVPCWCLLYLLRDITCPR